MKDPAAKYHHFFKMHPTHTVSFWLPDRRTPTTRTPFSYQNRKCNAILSDKAKINLKNCFTWVKIISNKKKVYSIKEKKTFYFTLAFITLTLSDIQIHSDDFIKQHMLEPFLRWMARSWSCNSYIWKAEVQNNGNIHFHITINKFIHWKSIRAKWNRLLSKHGYCKVFQDGTNDKGNAATEIKAVINEKQITSYIVGYISKKDLFKKIKVPPQNKTSYHISETCNISTHFYLKENYRQMECSDGTVREYKRQIHGRLWSASQNLNAAAIYIKDTMGIYESLSGVMNDRRLVDIKEFDYHKLYLYKQKIGKFLPISLREQINDRIHEMKTQDKKQTYIKVESLF